MKDHFKIRKLRKTDAEEVKAVALRSWKYTYNDIFSLDKIIEFNHSRYKISNLHKLVDISDNLFEFLVLEDLEHNRIIGFSQTGYLKLDHYSTSPS